MAGPMKFLKKFAALVLLAAFASFFTCISLINASFLYYFWLPFLCIHYIFAGVIKYIHHREDTRQEERHKFSGTFLCIVYLGFSTGVSILYTSIIISLCTDPYCNQIRSTTTDPIIIYTILAILEYLNLCVFFDLCFIKYAGTRNFVYRLTCQFPAILHTTTCVFSSFILWLYPIFAYLTVYQSSSDIMTYSPIFLYACVYLYSLNGLYNSIWTSWSYIHIAMKNINSSNNNQQRLLSQNDTNTQNLVENKAKSSYASPIRCDAKEYKLKNQEEAKYQFAHNQNSTIRLIQITDPHLGPLCSVNRLKSICADVVDKNPDLVLLTGDFYTGEANMDGLLIKALEPLRAINSKCFACLGNHDMETNKVLYRTMNELKALGIRLLRNESVVYNGIARVGPIQLIGFDYMHHADANRKSIMMQVMQMNQCPLECEKRRIVLLHDPGAFKYLSTDEGVIVFSGHTHGGHCGVLSCGKQWTFLHQFLKLPDNGLWQMGNNYLYIHRGQGSRALYGNYVLRNGVPTENSLVNIEW